MEKQEETTSATPLWTDIHRSVTGMSHDQLARKMDVDPRYLSFFERVEQKISLDKVVEGRLKIYVSPRAAEQFVRIITYINSEEALNLTLSDYLGLSVIICEDVPSRRITIS